jgi:hypothetical protein
MKEGNAMSDDFFDDFEDLGVEDWMIIGPLAEELADEERERRRVEEDLEQDEGDAEDEEL